MLICALVFCLRPPLRQPVLRGHVFHQIVPAGRHPVAVLKFDRAGVHVPARKNFAGS